MSIFFPNGQNNITNTFVPDLQDKVLLDSEGLSGVATLDQVRDLMIDGLVISDITGLQTAIDGKLPSTNTKAQFDTSCTDDNFAFLGQANTFTGSQTINNEGQVLTLNGSTHSYLGLSKAGSRKGYIGFPGAGLNYLKIKNEESSGGDIDIETGSGGNLLVNGQNRTSGWTSYTPTVSFSGGGSASSLSFAHAVYKEIGPNISFSIKGIMQVNSGSGTIQFSMPVAPANYDTTFTGNIQALFNTVSVWFPTRSGSNFIFQKGPGLVVSASDFGSGTDIEFRISGTYPKS